MKYLLWAATVTDLDEVIHLSEYDPQWAVLFCAEAERISLALPTDVTIDHIGSTAVPGLIAKPIIDIMVGAEPHHRLEAIRSALVDLGYEDMGEAGVPGRIYFRRRIGTAFNIALALRGGAVWVANLAFRDHLRTNPEARGEYAETKRHAFDSGIQSLLAYSEYKSAVVSRGTIRASRLLILQAFGRTLP